MLNKSGRAQVWGKGAGSPHEADVAPIPVYSVASCYTTDGLKIPLPVIPDSMPLRAISASLRFAPCGGELRFGVQGNGNPFASLAA